MNGPTSTRRSQSWRARLLASLARMGDALWPPPADAGAVDARALGIYAAVALAVALLFVLRRLDGITNPQFWAEDGTVFFQDNLKLGCAGALRTFFRGFPYVLQRLVACAATPLPLVSAPLAYHLAGYAISAACLATFTLPLFRHVIRSDALRVLWCLAVAAQPQARTLIASLTNTSWFMGIWLMLLTTMRLPRSPTALAGLAGAAWLASFSTPLSILTAPLWLARAVHAASKRQRSDAVFAVVAAVAVVALVAMAGSLGRDPGPTPWPFRALLNIVSVRVLAEVALGPGLVRSLVDHLGTGTVYAVAAGLLVVLGMLAWRVRHRAAAPFLAYSAYGIIASCGLALLGHRYLVAVAARPEPLIVRPHLLGGRYVVLAVTLLYLAFLVTVDRLPRPGGRAVAIGAVLAWLIASEAPTFRLPPFFDLNWPMYAAQLERHLADDTLPALTIPINPDRYAYRFNLAFDNRVHFLDVEPRGYEMLAALVDDTIVEQRFVARCSRLSELTVPFGAQGRPTGTVQVDLLEEGSEAVLASSTVDASAIHSPLEAATTKLRAAAVPMNEQLARAIDTLHTNHAMYFPPIIASKDRRYVIRVRATGGRPGNAITVYGRSDDYADGDARRNHQPLAHDVAFRYGCTKPRSAASILQRPRQ